MRINSIDSNNFKGYDARPLKGFFMGSNAHGIANEIQRIGEKEGFKVYAKIRNARGSFCRPTLPTLSPFGSTRDLWAQDIITFLKGHLLAFTNKYETDSICDFFNIKRVVTQNHISGGNFFIVDNEGEDDLFIGEKELEKHSLFELKDLYKVNKIHIIPQADFHLDLFMRPLDQKRILIADDQMSIKILEKGLNKFKEFVKTNKIEKNPISKIILDKFEEIILEFKFDSSINNNPKTIDISHIIKRAGYEPIPVPGRIYTTIIQKNDKTQLSHDCNYMNANVIINKDDELVYITNKSNIDKILGLETDFTKDFSFRFEKEFIKSISPYVKPDKVYFIDGEDNHISNTMLKEMLGGIHCVCSEIPANIGIKNDKNK